MSHKTPIKDAENRHLRVMQGVVDDWHQLQHALNQQDQLEENEKAAKEKKEKLLAKANGVMMEDATPMEVDQQVGTQAEGKGKEKERKEEKKKDEKDEEEAEGEFKSCPICFDELTDCSVTPCGHSFCLFCIRQWLETNANCPSCRKPLRDEQLMNARANMEEVSDGVNRDYGAKVSAVVRELLAIKERDPTAKSVVFSSWGRLLQLVRTHNLHLCSYMVVTFFEYAILMVS